jgi:hypothetical protein
MTEKGVCLVVLWTIVRYENNNSGKKISQSFWSSLQIFSIICCIVWFEPLYEAVCVSNHIKPCPKCQHCGYLKKPDDVPIHPIPIVAPWYRVGIDLVKMTKSKSGNSYILSLVDYLIWSRHCLDASTAFLSGQCVYIWVKVEYHKIIWVGMAYREDISIWN